MNYQTRSGLCAGLLASALLAACASVPPPTAQLDAADRAVRSADALSPRGPAQQALSEARTRLNAARDAANRGRNEEALSLAQQADAAAQYAAAEARRAMLEAEVDSKGARNAELRRRVLIQGD
jgi:hypothetical protein